MEVLSLSIACYLLGSIPSGVLLAKLFRMKDPRSIGSGNIGASNMTRLGGKKLGLYTLLADFSKAFFPLLLLQSQFPEKTLILPGFFLYSGTLLLYISSFCGRKRSCYQLCNAAGFYSRIPPSSSHLGAYFLLQENYLPICSCCLCLSSRCFSIICGFFWNYLPLSRAGCAYFLEA